MKNRYLLFSYDQYYPGGGWTDFDRGFDDLEIAIKFVELEKYKRDFYEIVDVELQKEVWNNLGTHQRNGGSE